MTKRQAYHRARQRKDRWQGQVATHLARLEELLTGTWPDGTPRRPAGAELPPLPESIAQAWRLYDPNDAKNW